MGNTLIKQTAKNTLLSIALFILLFLLLYGAEMLFDNVNLLKWNDAAWRIGIPASIAGVAYVLTIRDPNNYYGFYLGILMSLLLAVQFYLQGNYDLMVLYVMVFVPFQMKSVINWRRSTDSNGDTQEFKPMFLSMRSMLLSFLCFLLVIVADWLLVTYIINHDSLTDGAVLKLMGSLMISSSVLANFWLMYRKNDAWIFWVIYSISGIAFYVVMGNIFSIVLFTFFLVINSMAGISWVRNTPKENFGWLSKIVS